MQGVGEARVSSVRGEKAAQWLVGLRLLHDAPAFEADEALMCRRGGFLSSSGLWSGRDPEPQNSVPILGRDS